MRTALRFAKQSWYEAQLWPYADAGGLDPIWSEDFGDECLYGRVRVRNPFHQGFHEDSAPAYQP